MTSRPMAGLCVWIVITSAAAAAQQNGGATDTQPLPATNVTEYTFPAGGFTPFRRVETRTESGGRKVLIETVATPRVEGKWEPLEEIVTETTRAGSTTESTKRDVFRFDAQRRRRLAETTQSDQETRANANIRTERTWAADLDGHLGPASGRIEETRSVVRGIQQTDATLLLTGPATSLREVERLESTEHQVNANVVRHESTHLVRDVNGRWLPTETRSAERRGVGSAEQVEEETVHRPNLSGTLVLHEKIVTRRSESNGEDRVVIETYSQAAEGFVRPDSRLALRQRVRRSTTVAANGDRNTVEEIEARNPLAPTDPMRVVQRTLVTVHRATSARRVTERQVFERDANGRLVLVTNTTEEATEK